jgi:predicted DCC family thiol-disulfide oxidoreductase YuxK
MLSRSIAAAGGIALLGTALGLKNARAGQRLVVWDDSCSFCKRWVSLVSRADVLHALRFIGSSSPEAYDGTGVTPQAAGQAVQVVLPDGSIRAGFSGVQSILEVIPLVCLIAPYLSLPIVRSLGDRAYRHVAARRSCAYVTAPATANSLQ